MNVHPVFIRGSEPIHRFKRFLQLAEISRIDDTGKIITSLGIAEKQEGELYFNNGGILFFAKEPQRFIPWSIFTVLK